MSEVRKCCPVLLHIGRRCLPVAMIMALGAAQAPAQCLEQQKLTASDAAPGDEFGDTVSVSGDAAVFGASFKSCAAGSFCGAAYVYRFNGNTWLQEQKLTQSDASAGDRLGESVSISGNAAVVGAFRDGCTVDTDCGSAYVFRFDGASWIEEQKLTASDGAELDQFGISVSISGDAAIVGARWDDCTDGADCGAAYVFRFNGTAWVEEQKLTASDAGENDVFGRAVLINGDTAVVGALQDDCPAGDWCGSAYVFRFNGSSWEEEQKLTASDAAASDFFGASVSVDGDTVVVGAQADDCAAGTDCGSAYVFRFNGTSWDQEQKLAAVNAETQDGFGSSVFVSGNTVIVGATGDDCAAGLNSNCGAAFVFRFNGSSWEEEQKLTASDADAGDQFADSISVSGETAVIGAFKSDCAAGEDCGSVYVFRCPPPGIIPALSTWALAGLTLLMLTAGTILARRQKREYSTAS